MFRMTRPKYQAYQKRDAGPLTPEEIRASYTEHYGAEPKEVRQIHPLAYNIWIAGPLPAEPGELVSVFEPEPEPVLELESTAAALPGQEQLPLL